MDPAPLPSTSLSEYIDAVVPGLPHGLLGEGDLLRLREAAHELPAALQRLFCFEFRLDDASAGVDLSVCADIACGGRAILAGLHPRIRIPEVMWSSPHWRRVRDFATHWAEPANLLHGTVRDVWLEFDLPATKSVARPPEPSFYFTPHLPKREAVTETHQRSQEELVRDGMATLFGHALPAETEQRLRRCLRALPAHGHVFAIGAMMPRNDFRVRLTLDYLSPEETLAFLKTIRPVQDEHIRESLEWARGYFDSIRIIIDVGEEVGDTVGLEFYVNEPESPVRSRERWALLLDQLVSRGLCLPSRRDALASGPGSRRSRESGGRWPGDLTQIEQVVGMESVLAWRLSHVKLVCQPGKAPRAKAYVFFWNTWAWR
jgi:hypothetical protein